jgi:hypothetical protein
MNLTFSDLTQIGGFGMGGAVLASAYSLFQLYACQKIGIKLVVETCALQDDEQLFGYIKLLQDDFVSKDDDIIYKRIVDAIDNLVFLRMKLHTKDIKPGMEDRVESYVLFKRVQTNLKTIIENCKKEPRDIIRLQKLASNIADRTEKHLIAVMRICKNL